MPPSTKRDGEKNYGKPCVICGKGTVGQRWVEVDYMRGNDELVRVCREHWNYYEDILRPFQG